MKGSAGAANSARQSEISAGSAQPYQFARV
jgi:hypothetical protein